MMVRIQMCIGAAIFFVALIGLIFHRLNIDYMVADQFIAATFGACLTYFMIRKVNL